MILYHTSVKNTLNLEDYPLFAIDDVQKSKAFIDNYWNKQQQQFIYELQLKPCKIKTAEKNDDIIIELISNPDEQYLNELVKQLIVKYGEFDVLQYSDYDPEDDQKDYNGCYLILHPTKVIQKITKINQNRNMITLIYVGYTSDSGDSVNDYYVEFSHGNTPKEALANMEPAVDSFILLNSELYASDKDIPDSILNQLQSKWNGETPPSDIEDEIDSKLKSYNLKPISLGKFNNKTFDEFQSSFGFNESININENKNKNSSIEEQDVASSIARSLKKKYKNTVLDTSATALDRYNKLKNTKVTAPHVLWTGSSPKLADIAILMPNRYNGFVEVKHSISNAFFTLQFNIDKDGTLTYKTNTYFKSNGKFVDNSMEKALLGFNELPTFFEDTLSDFWKQNNINDNQSDTLKKINSDSKLKKNFLDTLNKNKIKVSGDDLARLLISFYAINKDVELFNICDRFLAPPSTKDKIETPWFKEEFTPLNKIFDEAEFRFRIKKQDDTYVLVADMYLTAPTSEYTTDSMLTAK